ncbi:MAG: trypsin-like peptidase domain-containing protein, partial [Planctomycetia bacterium]|nr:trypsin-like peptidase domain-containing protein [Planctomycetia bacterium]
MAVALWESRPGPSVAEAQGPRLTPSTSPEPAKKPAAREPGSRPPHAAGLGTSLGPDELSQDEQINIDVYESCNRSVVNITTKGVRAEGFFMLEVPTEGAGSGSVIDKTGHILTNNHVIDGARQVTVTLFDGKSYEARYVGADPINDVAVIKVEAPIESLHPVVFGDSRNLKVGMRVFAIGNPFGLERTLTTGIVSSLNRALQIHEHRTVKSIIQIDAAINPGNSGGPLLDSHARLIGMNTAIATRTGQSSGVGFAIPAGLIARIVPQLIEKGRVIRPEVGISKVFET